MKEEKKELKSIKKENQAELIKKKLEIIKNEKERIIELGIGDEILNWLFKNKVDRILEQKGQLYEDLDSKTRIVNNHHELTKAIEEHQKRMEKLGSWLIYGKRTELKEVWGKILRETRRGLLGVESKIELIKNHPKGFDCVIFITTADYQDENEVRRVRDKLKDLGFVDQLQYAINAPSRKEDAVKYLI